MNVWNVWNVVEIKTVNLGHFLFMSLLMTFYALILPQASCEFILPQAWSESIVRASPEKREVRDGCSSDLFVFDLIEVWSESVFPPWSGVLHL